MRAISETAVAMRVWSWRSKPSSSAMLARALARDDDVVLADAAATVKMRDLHRAPSPGHDHRGVVAAAREIAVEHAGDEAGMALERGPG